ncbi:MAG: ATP-binding protein [Ignavibacteria bacterium]|nr:ATP-binding protein [Ignavibacteria bacterium]
MKRYSSVVFASIISIVLVYSLLIIYQNFTTFKKTFLQYQTNELNKLNNLIETRLLENRELSIIDNKPTTDFLLKVDSLLNVRITVIDSTGRVLFDTREDASKMENHSLRPEIVEAKRTGHGTAFRYSTTMKAECIYAAKKVNFKDNFLGFVRTSAERESFNFLFADLQQKIILTFLGMFGGIILISYLLSKRLTKPIHEVIEASKKVAEGDFTVSLDERGDSELATLKKNFNTMVEEMKKSLESIKEQRDFMHNVINLIDQAIAIINKDCNLVFANLNYRTLLLKNEKNNKLKQIAKEASLVQQIEQALKSNKDNSKEIQLEDKIYLSTVKHLKNSTEIIHLVYDITNLKRIENIKRDLVANVSHELRTPLTAIKGYLETLEEEVQGEQIRYVETIKKNTERIIHIVDDLLHLMSLEDVSSKLFISDVNLVEITEQVIPTFKHRLEEKNLKIEVSVEQDFPTIKADAFRMEQVFINLIDNAIKYSENGTIKINLKRDDEETVKIEFQDEGIGIPRQHLDRIFERFYVVDKSRSRKSGGSGLGLSIVKHIILLHDGNIQVESEEGRGTKFTILLPIN